MGDQNKDLMKRRILVLRELFYRQTDEEHTLSTHEILDYLEEQGLPTNRKTLKSDLDLLAGEGMDIVTIASKPNRYFLGERDFELPELKLLIDAVSSSRFITQKKSRELARKLGNFASEHQRQELDRHIYAMNRIKSNNEEIYYTVDRVNEAISKRRRIRFRYIEYNVKKKKEFRNGGEVYELSPYALFWNEDYYYVVGWSEKHGNVSAFRVDRMYKPEITEEKAVRRPQGFSLASYSRQIFEMYDGDTFMTELECRNDLMKYIIDRFGEEVRVHPRTESTFVATVDVALSPTFYGWVFQFGGGIRILSPARAREEMAKMVSAQGL